MTDLRVYRWMWTLALGVVLILPIALFGLVNEHDRFWLGMTDVTGLLAMSFIASVIVMASRMRSITRAFGMQTVMGVHRYIGLLATATTAAHVVCVLIVDPANITLLTPFAPLRAVAGMVGLLGICAISGVAAIRSKFKHDVWLWAHIALSMLILAAVTAHIVLINHLVSQKLEGPFLGALGGILVVVIAARWIAMPLNPNATFVVVEIRDESESVATIKLRPRRKNKSPIHFSPGQFAWIRLRRLPIAEHPFTISSAAQEVFYPTFTFRKRGDWTTNRLLKLEPGDQVWVDGPHGGMSPADDAQTLVMVAGGVGITPMMSILRTMAIAGDVRPVRLFLSDRSEDKLFRDEIGVLHSYLQMEVTELGQRRVTAERLSPRFPSAYIRERTDYFVCGAPLLVRDAIESFAELGVPPHRVRTELFDLM